MSKYSEERIVRMLRKIEKIPASVVATKHGVSDVTIYAWREHF